MQIELTRFFTTEEVRKEYRVPDSLAPKILPKLPVVEELDDGTLIHLESEVDECLAAFARERRKAEAQHHTPHEGRRGRRQDTLEIAIFANQLRHEGKTWKEVLSACKKRWPGDDRVKNSDQIRATWRRHFGEKSN